MTILRGLGVAIILHAIFNFLLQLNQILPVVAYIIAGFLLLLYMLSRKAGKLILITDESEGRSSTMARKDEEVVIELIGMWFRDKRYVDVIHICERLMERDPDNKIIQLFKAQALDKMDSRSAYAKILKNMYPKGKKEKSPCRRWSQRKSSMRKKEKRQNQSNLPVHSRQIQKRMKKGPLTWISRDVSKKEVFRYNA